MTANDEYIVEVLTGEGLITKSQGELALKNAEKEEQNVIDILTRDASLAKMDILSTLASLFNMETVSLQEMTIDPEAIEAIPAQVAYRYEVIPLSRTENAITVALRDPFDMDTLDSLRYILKMNVEGVVALGEEIDVMLPQFYPKGEISIDSAWKDLTKPDETVIVNKPKDAESDETTEDDEPIIKLVNLIIIEAFRRDASDIHLEPLEQKFRVRYRIDGVLHEVDSPPKRLQPAIISRLKIMANMSIAEKRIPLDGRINITVLGKELDLRVNSIPTNHGESIVMRILDKSGLKLGLAQLGFFSDDQQSFERLIGSADGIILVTGPTGSGKTTTLYSCLHFVNRPDRKIITVEDPVEYQLNGINQVQVKSSIGFTFASALRAILRQAPNIIMIGEIRDLETAEIAINASLTGHLVFSTLHTNDAPGAVTRLSDMGVKPFLVASSTRAIMAQRLVRRICSKCKVAYEPSRQDLRVLGPMAEQMSEMQVFKGQGCNECNHTGYKGRVGIYEILVISEEIRSMIFDEVSSAELRAQGRDLGMRTLREDGLRKVMAGMTTLDEVFRVTMGDIS